MYRCLDEIGRHKETVEAHLQGMEPGGRLWQQTRRRGTSGARLTEGKTLKGMDSGLWVLGMGHGAGRGLLRRLR